MTAGDAVDRASSSKANRQEYETRPAERSLTTVLGLGSLGFPA
jgi:hypothetical protein